MNNFIQASESANHCQRNWSDKLVSADTIEELAAIATNMPTKQNEEFYTLLCSTDAEYNYTAYMHSYNVEPSVLELPFEERHKTNFNTQLRAPLIFQWFSNTKKNFKHGDYWTDGLLSIGISSGAVALAANNMGLKTGFCVCVHQEPIIEIVNRKHNTTFDRIVISLGIGYPDNSYKHNVVIRPNGEKSLKPIYKKTVRYILQ
jgi:hypothetical protein